MRFLAYCDFIGTKFVGWQTQPGQVSIQSSLEGALATFFRKPIAVVGCGRTDAGVHGRNYAFHFDLDEDINPQHLAFKLNCILDADIAVRNIIPVHDNFHARFDALSRSYRYAIHTAKDPFLIQTSWHNPRLWNADLDRLNEVAGIIATHTHFGALCKRGSNNKTTICHIQHCLWHRAGHQLVMDITASRFLRGMVRLIVGATVNVVRDRLSLDTLKTHLDREVQMPNTLSAPANGLMFVGVVY